MTRGRIILGVGLLASLAWLLAAALGMQVMPSYLAGWLFCLSLPVGALPLLMLLELLGLQDRPLTATLRRILPLQPAVALAALPVLLREQALYHRPGLSPGLARWMAPAPFNGRMALILLIWTVLCLVFSRPPRRPRHTLAGFGLCLHAAVASLAAFDWILFLEPGLNSSAFAVLAISAQLSVALCAACLGLALGASGRSMPTELAPLMLLTLAGWVFLHFIQFLVIWSADLPDEIVWYQHRIVGLGGTALWFGFAASLLTLALLLAPRLRRVPWVLASIAAMLLLVHLIETLWLVTPAFRGRFTVSLPDGLAMLGLVALSASLLGTHRLRVRQR